MKKTLSSLILLIIFLFGVSFSVNAATEDVYNVVTCPGENMATTMRINFQSVSSINKLFVEYTVATDVAYANAEKVEASYVEFSRQDTNKAKYSGMSTARHVWNVELTGLTPKTKYLYRIVSDTKVYVTDYSFETASDISEEFSFLFMTDPQYYNESGAMRFNEMTEQHIKDSDIKFTFITGDITDKGGNSSYWNMFYTKSSLKKVPFATTVGNHEYYDNGTNTVDNSIYNNFFNNPQNGPENCKGSSYYFLYNNVLFIMLDSEIKGKDVELIQWFRNVCSSFTPDYIIVGCHRSCYAGAQYYSDGVAFLKIWGSIFDECSVDLVLSGHDHMFARTKNLYKDAICTEPYKGTTYILGGSAGTKYYSMKNDTNKPKWACYFDNTTVSTVITLTDNGIKTKTIDYSGNVKDQSTLVKKRFGTVDNNFNKETFEKSFTIKNNNPDLTSGEITWDKSGYGHVISMDFTLKNNNRRIDRMMYLNETCTQLKIKEILWIGEINEVEVEISYKDKTKSTITLELDNRIDWGSIGKLKKPEVTAETITLTWDQNIKSEYVYMYRIFRNDIVIKNIFLTDEDRALSEFTFEANSKNGIKPEQKYTIKVAAINVNGTIIWSDEVTVTTLEKDEPDVAYEKNMSKVAFGFFIENLLNNLKNN